MFYWRNRIKPIAQLVVRIAPLILMSASLSMHASVFAQLQSAKGQTAVSGPLAPAFITITQPSGPISLVEAPDYATRVWGAPWSMDDPLDVRQLDSPRCVYPNHFNHALSWCPAGFWCGQVRPDVSNPDLFLLHPLYSGSMFVGRTGHLRPLDAGYYRLLTFRMYIDSVDPGDPGLQVMWTNGTVADIGNRPKYGQTAFYKTYPGWNIYSIDLGAYSAGSAFQSQSTLAWSGNITGIRLDPGLTGMNNKIVQIDWVRLTPLVSQPLAWSTDQSGNVSIKIESTGQSDTLRLYQRNGDSTSPLMISAGAGSVNLPISLPAGNWYVRLVAGAQTSAPAGPWQIDLTPVVQFTKPSYTSGEDYATQMLDSPWDMNEPHDVYQALNTSQPTFSSGLLSSQSTENWPSTCAGPWADPALNLMNDNYWSPPTTTYPPIDTQKYRYLTFRLKVSGTPDISNGWVARVSWSNADATGGFKNCGITKGIPLHEGWNLVSLDLRDTTIIAQDDPCQNPWAAQARREQLRLDPHEVPQSTAYQIDYVLLTSGDVIKQGQPFPVQYTVNVPQPPTLDFYYDTDKNPANGRTPAARYSPPGFGGRWRAYLPTIRSMPGVPTVGTTYWWDTTNVPAGAYYLSAVVTQGTATTTWYSDIPVTVIP